LMQVSGTGHRIAAGDLRSMMDKSHTMAECFLHYAHVYAIQVAHTALANAVGTVEERLCRWLLMAHDRLGVDELRITHESLGLLLGVRRPAITIALQRLESRGLLSAARGVTTILNRNGLADCAHSFYGSPEAEYQRLFS
jgi:CRP-like cAMP-binding protein